MIPPDQQSGFPASHREPREPWEVSSSSTSVWSTLPSLFLATACFVSWSFPLISFPLSLRAGLLRAVVLFCPLFLQPGVLACFLSRNPKVGSQGLFCTLPSAFSIQLLREALTGYISRFHFLLWTRARELFLVGFFGLGMGLLLQNRSWDLF